MVYIFEIENILQNFFTNYLFFQVYEVLFQETSMKY